MSINAVSYSINAISRKARTRVYPGLRLSFEIIRNNTLSDYSISVYSYDDSWYQLNLIKNDDIVSGVIFAVRKAAFCSSFL
jgi:hypothetical protein